MDPTRNELLEILGQLGVTEFDMTNDYHELLTAVRDRLDDKTIREEVEMIRQRR